MAQPRIPAWFYPGAASFLVLFAISVYSNLYPPAAIGLAYEIRGGETYLSHVVPGLPGDRAGLRAGDHVVSMSGWPMNHPLARFARIVNLQPDLRDEVVVERDGRVISVRIDTHGREWIDAGTQRIILLLGVQLFSTLLGLFIVARRPRDRVALLGGWLLAALGAAPLTWPRGGRLRPPERRRDP